MFTTMVVYMIPRSSSASRLDIERSARPHVERIVFATVATVGPDGSPRTRVMHPVWFWDGGEEGRSPTALVSARPTPLKRAHVAHQPIVSCSYWDPEHATVTIEATAAWVADDERAEVWERIRAVPAPIGFDPSMIWPDGPSSIGCAFLRLEAHRIRVTAGGLDPVRWVASST